MVRGLMIASSVDPALPGLVAPPRAAQRQSCLRSCRPEGAQTGSGS